MMTRLALATLLSSFRTKVGSSASTSRGAVDQAMDRARILAAFGAQHQRRLAGEGGEGDLPLGVFGKLPRERRFADAGIAKQPENLRLAALQPCGDGRKARLPAAATSSQQGLGFCGFGHQNQIHARVPAAAYRLSMAPPGSFSVQGLGSSRQGLAPAPMTRD